MQAITVICGLKCCRPDAFGRFEEEGVFNAQTGADFLHWILERGGSAEPMELFKAFRGREPSNQALLRHMSIVRSQLRLLALSDG